MYNLSAKTNCWLSLTLLIIISHSILNTYTLNQLRRTNDALVQDYTIETNIRNLRRAFFHYYNFSLIAHLTNDSKDLENQERSRNQLITVLNEDENQILLPQVSKEFELVKKEVTQFLFMDLLSKPAITPRTAMLNHQRYGESTSELMEKLDQIERRSSEILKAQEKAASFVYRQSILLNLVVLLFGCALLVIIFRFFRKKIIHPILKLIEMAKKIKAGDLNERTTIVGCGELSEISRILNDAGEAILHRRKERLKFIGSVAHDMRNPLTAIALECDLVLLKAEQKAPPSLDKTLKTFTRIKNQVERLQKMAEDLLEISKFGSPRWNLTVSNLKIEKILQESIELFQNENKTKISLMEQSPPGEFEGDPERIKQVAANLISNAIKYSPPETRIEVAYGSSENCVYFEVKDFGIGIPSSEIDTIFEPFKRLEAGKSFSQGTGLGLTIVREIVDAHHGFISVLPRNGGGTTFLVEFPKSADIVDTGLRVHPSLMHDQKNDRKIL